MSDDTPHRMPFALELVLCVVVGLGIAFLVRSYVAEYYLVPSGSMLETIHEGDCLLGEKLSLRASAPKAGDVVTFDDPDDAGTTLIKRVVAVGGQTVELRDGVVYVDGRALDEPYVMGKPSYPLQQHSRLLDADISYPYVVPEGSIWVMGDNRTNSLDSRYFGAVSVESVTSRGLFIYWPLTDARWL
ncbi:MULTISPECIES: signal peptidase I [Olsenella]|uniref:signal peptidase I n=1 Tax=Olsenella TaxID=133925 RepID=UPI0007855956|nr:MULTISPECIES: signal peptidase I [Olsenella]KXB62630.1 signal peptidase I [Olsenella sp. DNF00959]